MKRVIIGMGSNVGDRADYLAKAIVRMAERVGSIERCSRVTETSAWGFDAPPFLNQAVVLRTYLSPLDLLDELQQIERELGRTEKTHYEQGLPVYSSRTIDLDILDYEGLVYQDERLTLPHPHIPEREFVRDEMTELGIRIVDNTSDGSFHLEYLNY